jgi:hypothetical protein
MNVTLAGFATETRAWLLIRVGAVIGLHATTAADPRGATRGS